MTDLSFLPLSRRCVCDSLYQIAAAVLAARTTSPLHMPPPHPHSRHIRVNHWLPEVHTDPLNGIRFTVHIGATCEFDGSNLCNRDAAGLWVHEGRPEPDFA